MVQSNTNVCYFCSSSQSLHVLLLLGICGIVGVQYPFLPHPSTSSSAPTTAVAPATRDVCSTAPIKMETTERSSNDGDLKTCPHLSLIPLFYTSILKIFGPFDSILMYYCSPALSYVALYSNLPHKVVQLIATHCLFLCLSMSWCIFK